MKYCFILWTRPEIIKLYSCIKYCENNNLEYFLIHTNQHYSENMDKVFFDQLNLSPPKYNLDINGGTHAHMTWKMMIAIEDILTTERPDIVFVQWDTNTVLAGALTASKMWLKVAHIEAWLRSGDRSMPEEINRILTDHVSDFLFPPTKKQTHTLLKESIADNKIKAVWNTITDITYSVSKEVEVKEEMILKTYHLENNDYILFTSHRPSNVDYKEPLLSLLTWIKEIQKLSGKKILFPIHPRTRANIEKFGMEDLIKDFVVIDPVWFHENIIFEKNAFMIATDSWWIQEEACILEKKTLVLRENTERPETLEVWGALLVGNKKEKIIEWFHDLKNKNIDWYNPFWDWKTADYIFQFIWSEIQT